MENNYLSRRKFNTKILIGAFGLGASHSLFAQKKIIFKKEIDWFDAKDIGVEGKGWTDTKRYFDRLPSKAEGIVRNPVWNLSRHSAGMCLRFETDSPNIMFVINYIQKGFR